MAISERVILGQIHEAFEDKGEWLRQGSKFEKIFMWGSALTIIPAIALEYFTLLNGSLCVMLGVVGGMLLGMSNYVRLIHSIWPHLAPYIDRNSLKERLALLESAEID